MTRDEAISYKWFMLDLEDKEMESMYENHINRIYDSFEEENKRLKEEIKELKNCTGTFESVVCGALDRNKK